MAYAAHLKAIMASPFAPLVAPLTLGVHVDENGLVHSPSRCSRIPSIAKAYEAEAQTKRNYGRSYYNSPNTIPEAKVNRTLTLAEFTGEKICTWCETSLMRYGQGWDSKKTFADVSWFVDTQDKLTRMRKVTKSTTASAVQKRLNDAEYVERDIAAREAHSRSPLRTKEVLDALDVLKDETQRVKKLLKGLAVSDETREKIEVKVRELMLPKRFSGQDVALDRTMKLIGVSPAPQYRGHQIGAVIDAYAIRNDSATVLVAPAYVFSFLLQQLFPKSSANTLVVATELPKDETLRETAAGLWDPEGESALACIQKSVEAARAVLGLDALDEAPADGIMLDEVATV